MNNPNLCYHTKNRLPIVILSMLSIGIIGLLGLTSQAIDLQIEKENTLQKIEKCEKDINKLK